MPAKNILQTKSKEFQEKIKNAPKLPGCYLYKNTKGKVLYVGKAKNLSNRVKSYFANFKNLELGKKIMIEEAVDIDYIIVDSEIEALILETNLIKKYRPKHNVLMKDDKNYIYVRFEKIRKANQPLPTRDSPYQDFPRITIVRKAEEDGAEYFGPFPNTFPVKRILRQLRKIFPYRTSKHLVYQISENPLQIFSEQKKPDLYYHIGLSNGADAGLEPKKAYLKNFKQVRRFFRGEKRKIIEDLTKQMNKAARKKDFETAAYFRDKIQDINYITTHSTITKDVDDVIVQQIKTQERNRAIDSLIEQLKFPSDILKNKKNFRIECYDISNIQGTNAVGSMVVMIDGQIRPDLYRRFKIRMKNEPNDFAMLQEVLTRRLRQLALAKQYEYQLKENPEEFHSYVKKLLQNIELDKDLKQRAKNWKPDESFSMKPDLIIIDGGKGQLASTYKILYKFGLHNDIPIIGLAKREEEIFKLKGQFDDNFQEINNSSMFSKIKLPKRSESLYLVQRIRDEAHRFAITYHRNLRSKKLLNS
ncbi:MAG: hypothetical protein Kow0081_0110 [Candidatus Dojkabacteria bacterium]